MLNIVIKAYPHPLVNLFENLLDSSYGHTSTFCKYCSATVFPEKRQKKSPAEINQQGII